MNFFKECRLIIGFNYWLINTSFKKWLYDLESISSWWTMILCGKQRQLTLCIDPEKIKEKQHLKEESTSCIQDIYEYLFMYIYIYPSWLHKNLSGKLWEFSDIKWKYGLYSRKLVILLYKYNAILPYASFLEFCGQIINIERPNNFNSLNNRQLKSWRPLAIQVLGPYKLRIIVPIENELMNFSWFSGPYFSFDMCT